MKRALLLPLSLCVAAAVACSAFGVDEPGTVPSEAGAPLDAAARDVASPIDVAADAPFTCVGSTVESCLDFDHPSAPTWKRGAEQNGHGHDPIVIGGVLVSKIDPSSELE